MRTFQLSRELGGLTVLENLLVAPKVQAGESLFNIFFRPRLLKREERQNLERATEILRTYGLYELRDNRARELSGGQKKLLEISRGVMASPSLFLLDEPMAGVNPALIEKIGGYILDMKAQGVTVLMIEHNLNVVERICDNVIVLAEGRTLATGRLSDLRENKEVVTAYLGEIIDAGSSHGKHHGRLRSQRHHLQYRPERRGGNDHHHHWAQWRGKVHLRQDSGGYLEDPDRSHRGQRPRHHQDARSPDSAPRAGLRTSE
jgi:ABC-type multidrug transport system ATPase subunit